MCGRFMLTSDARALKDHFQLNLLTASVTPRYNIAPTQQIAAVVEHDHERSLVEFRWGLVPRWAKDLSIGSKMINARAETIADKPAYKPALARRRCLIPANGFYEWQRSGDHPGPRRFELESGQIFAIAGLWESWFDPDGMEVRSCTIITTSANDQVKGVHDRMPAILTPEDENRWLDPASTVPDLLSLIVPTPSTNLNCIAVTKRLNFAGYDGPELLEAV